VATGFLFDGNDTILASTTFLVHFRLTGTKSRATFVKVTRLSAFLGVADAGAASGASNIFDR
jgi:hypothetical protein